jgi:hypothetical protein
MGTLQQESRVRWHRQAGGAIPGCCGKTMRNYMKRHAFVAEG